MRTSPAPALCFPRLTNQSRTNLATGEPFFAFQDHSKIGDRVRPIAKWNLSSGSFAVLNCLAHSLCCRMVPLITQWSAWPIHLAYSSITENLSFFGRSSVPLSLSLSKEFHTFCKRSPSAGMHKVLIALWIDAIDWMSNKCVLMSAPHLLLMSCLPTDGRRCLPNTSLNIVRPFPPFALLV